MRIGAAIRNGVGAEHPPVCGRLQHNSQALGLPRRSGYHLSGSIAASTTALAHPR
jgi:hypothetical protein